MRLTVSIKDFDNIISNFDLSTKQIRKVTNNVVRKSTTRFRNISVNLIHKEYGISKSTANLRGVRTRRNYQAGLGSIWIGFNPIKAAYLGRLSQGIGFAKAGKHRFDKGFIRTFQSGHTTIVKRVEDKLKEQELKIDKVPILLQKRLKQFESEMEVMLENDLTREVSILNKSKRT